MAEVFCLFCYEMMAADAERCPHCGGVPADFARRPYPERLITALNHPLDDVRMRAIFALGKRRQGEAAVPLLDCALRWPTDVPQGIAIAQALTWISRRSRDWEPLRRLAAEHGSLMVRRAAERCLARSGRWLEDRQ